MCLRDLDNLSIPRGGGAGGRLQAWIRTRPAPADPTSIATVHDAVIAHMAIALRLIALAFAPAPEVGIKPACAALRREWWARLRPVFSVSDPRGTGSKRAGRRRSCAVPGSCGRSAIRVAALATEKSANENRHRDDVWRPLRDRWFESCSLQRRVICEPDFLDLAQEPPAAALRCNCRGRLDRRHPRSYPELRLSHGLAAWRVKADCDTLPGTNRWRHAGTGVGEVRARCPCTMCPGMHFW